jgi:hypothetical protein
MKARERRGILGKRFRKKLDGDYLGQPQILRAIDLPHAAASRQRHNTVAFRDNLAGSESPTADRIRTGQNGAP